MKSEKNILVAFLLNLFFSLFELLGGIAVGSIAILSDSLHDIGDALSIGVSYFFEKKSKQKADESYTYGYGRYSFVGAVIMSVILMIGSAGVCIAAIKRMIDPAQIKYDSMILVAVVGVVVNFIAAYMTHGSESVNERAVSLHMLEDVLGWVVVLIGAVVMRFTDMYLIDPIMSLCVAVYIFIHAYKNLRAATLIFVDKVPDNISVRKVHDRVMSVDGVLDVHHIHLRTVSVGVISASMHIVSKTAPKEIKEKVREALHELSVSHITLELEAEGEECSARDCYIHSDALHEHAHRHTHHHH